MSRLLVVVALVSLLPATVLARTIRVPSDEASIQGAVVVATDGDTVSVSPGTYVERFTIRFKGIVLRGEAGADATIIDGSVAPGNVITLHHVGREMIVEDLTITGGSFNLAAVESTGAAIYVNQGRPTIQRCKLTGNDANTGGGIAAYFFSRPRIEDCWIANNFGGGIFIETDDGEVPGGADEEKAQILNTTIVRNHGYGVSVIKGAKAEILKSTIAYNTGEGVRSEMTPGAGFGQCRVEVRHTLITNNGTSGIERRDGRVCFTLQCNNVWANPDESRNWVGVSEGDPCFRTRGAGSLSIDPMYNDPDNDDFSLQPTSFLLAQMCAPDNCGAPGADVECPVGVTNHTTWGAVKHKYR
jgi:nitrous oxidase accessory protein NosD